MVLLVYFQQALKDRLSANLASALSKIQVITSLEVDANEELAASKV